MVTIAEEEPQIPSKPKKGKFDHRIRNLIYK
jgi:hypothetical protein